MGEESIVAVSCGVGHRLGLDLGLLWLWCRPAAAAPIQPRAWEPPYVACAALKMSKKKTIPGERDRHKSRFCKKPNGLLNVGFSKLKRLKKIGNKKLDIGVPFMAQQKQIQLGTMSL